MSERINKQYRPAEINAAVDALKAKEYTEAEAIELIKALYVLGFRIVKAFEP